MATRVYVWDGRADASREIFIKLERVNAWHAAYSEAGPDAVPAVGIVAVNRAGEQVARIGVIGLAPDGFGVGLQLNDQNSQALLDAGFCVSSEQGTISSSAESS